MKKGTLILVALVLVIVIGWLVWQSQSVDQSVMPAAEEQLDNSAPATTTPTEDLQSVNLDDLQNEFQGIDKDVKSL